MKRKVFAILAEPASYTVDRNKAVYAPMGIGYCYMDASSLAKSDTEQSVKALNAMPLLELWRFLRKNLKENDIIILNGSRTRTGYVLLLLNLFYRKNIGLDSDSQLRIPDNIVKRIGKFLFYRLLYSDRHIYGLAGGSYTHKDDFRHYGMKEDHIFLSPMMVDNNRFAYSGQHIVSPFRFLYVGRIVEVKNIRLMIEAFLTAFRDSEDAELRIVGDGELLPELRRDFGGENNVVFTGAEYGEDLVKEYKQASAFVLPSSFEPWGLVVNEAMSAGLPVIVSDRVGSAWDLVENRDTGFIFKYDDSEQLSSFMKRLYTDMELYGTYSSNAYKIMQEYWNYVLYRRNLELFIETAGRR